jgi:hypothetical protein
MLYDEIMVTENVSNNAEACREKPKKWDETYKVDFVNNIDVDSIQNLEIQNHKTDFWIKRKYFKKKLVLYATNYLF